MLDPL